MDCWGWGHRGNSLGTVREARGRILEMSWGGGWLEGRNWEWDGGNGEAFRCDWGAQWKDFRDSHGV